MKESYKTFKQEGVSEVIEKKSKFLGIAKPITSEQEAWEIIDKTKKAHKEARHCVYAFCIDNIERMSDDGEPSGTAGIPLLNILKTNKIENAIIIVIRYFGGILLGCGGLTRAYSQTARKAAEDAKSIEMVLHEEIKVELNYNLLNIITKTEQKPREYSYIIKEIEYKENVEITMLVEQKAVEKHIEMIKELTNAAVKITKISKILAAKS